MKQILFATTNDRKLSEARAACKDFGIEVVQIELSIDEIQHHDPNAISIRKAADAFKLAEGPVVVTDTSWAIPALNGFPGGYMKEVAQWFTSDDFLKLMNGQENRQLTFTESITYKDAHTSRTFSQQYAGQFAESPRGKGNSIERIAEFDGYTIAERHDQGRNSHDPKDYIWYQFARWFSDYEPSK